MSATDVYIWNSWLVYVLSVGVLLHYFSQHWLRHNAKWHPYDWLLAGICISFLGKIADGIYWHATWSALLNGSPVAEQMLADGTFWNLWFRQLPIIAASVCHLRAAWLVYDEAPQRSGFIAAIALAVGSIIWVTTALLTGGLDIGMDDDEHSFDNK